MKLYRNVSLDGRGKYAVVRLRPLDSMAAVTAARARTALAMLEDIGIIDYGLAGEPDEFFVIKLRDRYARHALNAYADAVGMEDVQYMEDVQELADRSGELSPYCKVPD